MNNKIQFTPEYDHVFKLAIEKYGIPAQKEQLIEELFELGLAWQKCLRCQRVYGSEPSPEKKSAIYDNLIEEIADVFIMLRQLEFMESIEFEEFDTFNYEYIFISQAIANMILAVKSGKQQMWFRRSLLIELSYWMYDLDKFDSVQYAVDSKMSRFSKKVLGE